MPHEHYRVEIARDAEDAERLKPVWERVAWEREEAEPDYFLARLAARTNAVGLVAIFVIRGDEPAAAAVARVEARRLQTAVAYRTVYAPLVRLLQVVDGGIVAQDEEALAVLVETIGSMLSRGEVEAVALPPLPVGSALHTAFASLGSPLRRQRFLKPWTRRRLVLPGSFDEFVASRGTKTRKAIRRDEKLVAAALGDGVSVEIIRDPEELERLFADVESVARASYQRALGAGFSDTEEQRAIAEIGLRRGWLRGYLMHLNGAPIAYWLCSVYRDTMILRTGGYDEAYAEHRVGIHLLMRVIEDAIADPNLHVLDFGPGDTFYKRQFSSESVREQNLVVFAPTFRAVRINAVRSGILGVAHLARIVFDAGGLTDRVKSVRRRRARKEAAE